MVVRVAVVVDKAGVGRVAAVDAASSRVVPTVAHRKRQVNLRAVPVMRSPQVKTRGAAGKQNPQVKASVDAARVNLPTHSNLEARP